MSMRDILRMTAIMAALIPNGLEADAFGMLEYGNETRANNDLIFYSRYARVKKPRRARRVMRRMKQKQNNEQSHQH